MASTFPNRCLTFLMAVARFLLNLDVPLGYEDDTGFHRAKTDCSLRPTPHDARQQVGN